MNIIEFKGEKYPEIYYKPIILSDIEDCLVYDITSTTSNYSDEFINSTFTSIFNKYPELKRKLIRFKNISNRDTPNFSDGIIEIGSIFEYSNVIASCKVFITLLSGGSALASAIKKDNEYPKIYTFHHTLLDNKALMYTFDNIIFGTM